MGLRTKKRLAARVLGIGLERVMFDEAKIDEIKEALTRQDIKDLVKSGAIKIKDIEGRKRKKRRKTKRRGGKIKKRVGKRKKGYMILTRKLRKTLKSLKKAGVISKERYSKLMKETKAKAFKTRGHLMEVVRKI